jgi:hypothetical protein
MFDKLIESNSVEADFKPRGRYFTVSTVVVGILFLTAVMVSLYAQDFALGTDDFDVAELLAPIAPEAPQPPEPRQQTPRTNQQQQQSDVPQRQVNMMRIDETPTVPTDISVTPNKYQSRPATAFILSNTDLDPAGPPAGPRNAGEIKGTGSSLPVEDTETEAATVAKAPPPPQPPTVKKPPTQSLGVITGKALYLPKPAYTEAMRLMNAQGEVSVQVTVDEEGRVISSKALNGHPILRAPAERAALGAKFGTTYLSKVPVKVTGVIVYRFAK